MKLEMKEPFISKWKSAYLVTNSENRRNVCLVNSSTDRTTISYARYLMSINLGYIVPPEYEVDHIDNDKTNDDISNLQLLSKVDNLKKQADINRQNRILIHGTLTCYKYCKCTVCRTFASDYSREYRRKLKLLKSNINLDI
jgi:NAD-dependent SIR2 family protein deacetylase